MGYASKYGDSQSLKRLAERGGFAISEMDEYFPEWKEKTSIIKQLQAELATAKEIIENTKKCVANNPVYIYGPGQCMLEEALKEVKP